MSNYKYAIKKLPIKSWIKYWLWRNRTGGTKYKFVLSEIKEGSNFYLENTIKRKFNMFELYGKTTQNGTPTPENPIPIVNITGNINEEIQNKNFLGLQDKVQTTSLGLTYSVKDGKIIINGTASSSGGIEIPLKSPINCKNGTNYVLSKVISGTASNNNFNIQLRSNGASIKNPTAQSLPVTYNDLSGTIDGIRLYIGSGYAFTNYILELQLELGSTKTDYIAHAEQNISFPLAQGQVLAEGDYLADDGIHHKRGKVVFNGSEDWQKNTSFEKVFYLNNVITNRKTDIVNALSNYFIYGGLITSSGNLEEGKFYLWGNEQYISRIVLCINLSTLANLKTWLAEQYANGTPVEIEYELAEEVIDPYTEEQQIEYNKIKELYSYNEITNIDGDANLKIKYWERVER